MARTWAISFDESERMELERIIMDEDSAAAFEFLRKIVYKQVKESEKPSSCYHDVSKPVNHVERPIQKHRELGCC